MTFDDLKFDQVGCCGTHTWAQVQHDNGLRSDVYVYVSGDGGWRVVTWQGSTVYRGVRACATETDVLMQLAADAAVAF